MQEIIDHMKAFKNSEHWMYSSGEHFWESFFDELENKLSEDCIHCSYVFKDLKKVCTDCVNEHYTKLSAPMWIDEWVHQWRKYWYLEYYEQTKLKESFGRTLTECEIDCKLENLKNRVYDLEAAVNQLYINK